MVTERRVDKRGIAQATRKPTPTELERRRDAAVMLRRKGYTHEAIGVALGVPPTCVSQDLSARGAGGRIGGLKHTPPEPVPWRDGEVPTEPVPRWQRAALLGEVDSFCDVADADRYVQQLALYAIDATEARDEAWFNDALARIARAASLISHMHNVLTNATYRERRAYATAERDAMHIITTNHNERTRHADRQAGIK